MTALENPSVLHDRPSSTYSTPILRVQHHAPESGEEHYDQLEMNHRHHDNGGGDDDEMVVKSLKHDAQQTTTTENCSVVDDATSLTRKSRVLRRLEEVIQFANQLEGKSNHFHEQRQYAIEKQDQNFVCATEAAVTSRIVSASHALTNQRYSRLRHGGGIDKAGASSIEIGPRPQYNLRLELAYQRHNQRLHRKLIPPSSPAATSRIKRYGATASNFDFAATNRSNAVLATKDGVAMGSSLPEVTQREMHSNSSADSEKRRDDRILFLPENELKSNNQSNLNSNSQSLNKNGNVTTYTSTNKPIPITNTVAGKIVPRIISNVTTTEDLDLDRDDEDDDSGKDCSKKEGKERVTPKINMRKNMHSTVTSNPENIPKASIMPRVISDTTQHTYYFDDEGEEEEDETMHNEDVIDDVTGADADASADSLMVFLKMGVDYRKAIKEDDDEKSHNDLHDDKIDENANNYSRSEREKTAALDRFGTSDVNKSICKEEVVEAVEKSVDNVETDSSSTVKNMRTNEAAKYTNGDDEGWSSNHSPSTSSDASPYSSSSVSSAWSSSSGSSSFASSTSSSMEDSHVVQSFPSTPTSATTNSTATPNTATLLQKLKQRLHQQQQQGEEDHGGEPSSASTLVTLINIAGDETETDETLHNSTGEL